MTTLLLRLHDPPGEVLAVLAKRTERVRAVVPRVRRWHERDDVFSGRERRQGELAVRPRGHGSLRIADSDGVHSRLALVDGHDHAGDSWRRVQAIVPGPGRRRAEHRAGEVARTGSRRR